MEFILHQERTELVVQAAVELALMDQVVVQQEQQTLVVEVEGLGNRAVVAYNQDQVKVVDRVVVL